MSSLPLSLSLSPSLSFSSLEDDYTHHVSIGAITAAIFEYLNVRSLKYLDVSGTTIKGNQIPEPFKKIELFV